MIDKIKSILTLLVIFWACVSLLVIGMYFIAMATWVIAIPLTATWICLVLYIGIYVFERTL